MRERMFAVCLITALHITQRQLFSVPSMNAIYHLERPSFKKIWSSLFTVTSIEEEEYEDIDKVRIEGINMSENRC